MVDSSDPERKTEDRAEQNVLKHSSAMCPSEMSLHLLKGGQKLGVWVGKIPYCRNQEWEKTSFSSSNSFHCPSLAPYSGPINDL